MTTAAMRSVDFLRRHRGDVAVCLALLSGMFVVYSVLSVQLYRSPDRPFSYFDILFELDVPRAIDDMTDPSANHYRTVVHPLYVLLVNPFGAALAGLEIGGERHAHALASIALNSLFGAFSAVLSFVLFRAAGHGRGDALLLAAIFAFSMSQLALSLIPDTSSLATVSLLMTYLVFWSSLSRGGMPLAGWTLVGIFSFGVTTTNFIQTVICFGAAQAFGAGSFRLNGGIFKRFVYFGLSVLVPAFALAVLQKWLYPSSAYFFDAAAYSEDFDYVSLLILEEPLIVLGLLLKHMFLVNIAAPLPQGYDIGEPVPAVTFASSPAYLGAGYLALTLWIGIAWYGLCLHKNRQNALFYCGLTACLAFNILLHSVYGVTESGQMEYFLYTGNFTFLVIALLLGRMTPTPILRYGLALLLAAAAVNNLLVVNSIIRFYSGG